MPEIRFVGETHPELVRQVRAWLESTEAERSAADVVESSADLTKDALRLVAAAAPAPIAESELISRLTEMGYRATDLGRDGVLAGLESLATVGDGSLIRRASSRGAKVLYEMNTSVARQFLRSLRG